MPGYGLPDAESGKGLLPWSWAVERLADAHNYWLSTVREDGRPHMMPVWGVWIDSAFLFSTGERSRKARNLAANPNCVVSPERGDEAVIVEGIARRVTDASLIRRFCEAYKTKYDWEIDESLGPIYSVQPRTAFAFIESGDDFYNTATRWIFADD